MLRAIALFAVLALGACATTVSEERAPITLYGQTYDSVTRTFQTDGGRTFSRTTIYVGVQHVNCIPGDIRDCEAALQELRQRRDRF